MTPDHRSAGSGRSRAIHAAVARGAARLLRDRGEPTAICALLAEVGQATGADRVVVSGVQEEGAGDPPIWTRAGAASGQGGTRVSFPLSDDHGEGAVLELTVGPDRPEWDADEREALASAAEVLGAALERRGGAGGQDPDPDGSVVPAAVRTAMGELETFLDAMPDQAWLKDPQGRYLRVNRPFARDLGLSPEEVVGLRDEDFYPPELVEKFRRVDREVLETRRVVKVEEEMPRDHGPSRLWETVKAPLVGDGGEPTGVLGVARDITDRREAETRLRTQKEVLETVLGHLPVMVAIFDGDGRLTRVNRAWTENLGYTLEEAREEGFLARAHPVPSERERVRAEISAAAGEWSDVTVMTRDGGLLLTEWIQVRLPDGTSMGIGRDVTERRRAEAALRTSERRYRLLYETMGQGVIYQSVEGKITDANPAAERILGLTLGEMQGRATDDPRWRALREDGSEMPPEEHPSLVALRTGEEVLGVVMGIHDPGSDQHRWILVNAIPQFHPGEDTPYQVCATFSDVTDLRRARAQRAAAEDRVRLQLELLDAVDEAVVATDREGRVTYANRYACALHGLDEEEIVGRSITDLLVTAGRQDPVGSAVARLLKGEPWSGELLMRRGDGTAFPMLVTNTPLRGDDGRLRGMVSAGSDITARKALEEQLRQAQKMEAVGRLAGGIAHDFNNLLAVIGGNATLALDDMGEDGVGRAEVEEIAHAAERAADLTRQLLAFSRRQMMQPRVLDLGGVVREVESMLRRLIGEDIRFRTSVPERLGPVEADPGQVEQVIMNLVVNARDAMPRGGELWIAADEVELGREEAAALEVTPGAYVRLAVSDTGHGMDEATRRRVFEPFFTTKEVRKGTGLGLSTVFGIVKQSGGGIQVESRPGLGATFRIYLPRVEGPAPGHAPDEVTPR